MKQFTGTIISTKMQKTAVVEVTRQWKHPLYAKIVKRTKNYPAHYENMELAEGDVVTIQETRPVSKTVRFKVVGKVK